MCKKCYFIDKVTRRYDGILTTWSNLCIGTGNLRSQHEPRKLKTPDIFIQYRTTRIRRTFGTVPITNSLFTEIHIPHKTRLQSTDYALNETVLNIAYFNGSETLHIGRHYEQPCSSQLHILIAVSNLIRKTITGNLSGCQFQPYWKRVQ